MPWGKLSDILGLAKGGALRNAFEALWPAPGETTTGISRVTFTIAVIALCAKLTKADGVAVQVEAAAFERHFQMPPEEMANVRRLFDLAKQDVAGFESYADQIARLLADEPALLSDVLECLFHVATADGIMHQAEDAFLKIVAERFGVPPGDYQRMRALFVRDPESPYEVLGASPADSNEILKARHRSLVLEHHPDRLIARGVPREFMKMAEAKLATINAAWDAIRKERNL